MAFSHGIKATLKVGALQLEGYAESTSMGPWSGSRGCGT